MKKTLLLFTTFISLFSLFSQNVNIPDANFKSALVAHNSGTGQGTYVIDTNGDGEIPIDEASAYDGAIFVSHKSIADLTGLQSFPNIISIWCNGNQGITEIDLSENVELLEINCGGCRISIIDLTNNTKMQDFRCGGNQHISSLDFSNLPDLEILWCNNNKLTEIDLSNNPNLWQLYCYANKLTSVDISVVPGLRYFNTQENEITTIDLSNNPELVLINVSVNELTSLDVSNNTIVDALRYRDNPQLGDVDITNNSLIRVIQLWNTAATSLDLSMHTKIEEMECYDIPTLTSLNIANGNNNIIEKFNTTDTPNLSCIEVDDVDYSTENWTDISPENSFSTDCSSATTNVDFEEVNIYPNPVKNNLSIQIQENVEKIEVYNLQGQKVVESTETNVTVSNLSNGVYVLKIHSSNNKIGLRKFIKE